MFTVQQHLPKFYFQTERLYIFLWKLPIQIFKFENDEIENYTILLLKWRWKKKSSDKSDDNTGYFVEYSFQSSDLKTFHQSTVEQVGRSAGKIRTNLSFSIF